MYHLSNYAVDNPILSPKTLEPYATHKINYEPLPNFPTFFGVNLENTSIHKVKILAFSQQKHIIAGLAIL
jgi:hypothetical protein